MPDFNVDDAVMKLIEVAEEVHKLTLDQGVVGKRFWIFRGRAELDLLENATNFFKRWLAVMND